MSNNPPFLPISFPPGPPTAPAWESGPAKFAPVYNGQTQTSLINVRVPPPPAELGPGPADPQLSSAAASYTGSGYGPVGLGTVGVGNPVTVPAAGAPAQARVYVEGNQLVILDNVTGNAYAVPLAASIPQPPVYSPTK